VLGRYQKDCSISDKAREVGVRKRTVWRYLCRGLKRMRRPPARTPEGINLHISSASANSAVGPVEGIGSLAVADQLPSAHPTRFHLARRQIDGKEHHPWDEFASGRYFDQKGIACSQDIPVALEELLPRGLAGRVRLWVIAVLNEDVLDQGVSISYRRQTMYSLVRL
jgi:hypothetical protein